MFLQAEMKIISEFTTCGFKCRINLLDDSYFSMHLICFVEKFDPKKLKQILTPLVQKIKDLDKKKSTKLIEYSPWLKNFQSTELHADLEIPGQYNGEKRPLPQYHIKIMGFSPDVIYCFLYLQVKFCK